MFLETFDVAPATTGLRYPEGPCPLASGELLFVEYAANAVRRWDGAQVATVFAEPGLGPASVGAAPDGDLWVCAFDADALVRLDASGWELERHLRDAAGEPLPGPNDLAIDADGVVYATISGAFDPESVPAGAVVRVEAGSPPVRVATGLRFANGIALGPDGAVYVAEHFADRIVRYPRRADGTLGAGSLYADLSLLGGPRPRLRGPDGIAFDADGRLYVAHFGCARLAVVGPEGVGLDALPIPYAHPTNVAVVGPGRLVVTAFAEDRPPHTGALLEVVL